jgi:hypothetical protein
MRQQTDSWYCYFLQAADDLYIQGRRTVTWFFHLFIKQFHIVLKFLYSRTQNVAVPLCPGPPLNSEVWIWSQVSSCGICVVHYVTWTGFSPSICFPLLVSFLRCTMFVSPSIIDAISPWQLIPLRNNTHTGEEVSIQDLLDVTLFRMGGSRCFEGSWCLQLHGKNGPRILASTAMRT